MGTSQVWRHKQRIELAQFLRMLFQSFRPRAPRRSDGASCSGGILAGLILCLVPLAAAQQASASPEGPQVIRANSNLVLVRVVVRDAAGNAVPNLRLEDFRLFDESFDKKNPQAIASFTVEAANVGYLGTPAQVGSGATAAPAPASSLPTLTSSRHVALFFDDLHLQTDELARARKAAEQYVAQSLQPGDFIGVFDSSGKGMLDFTDDRGKLHDALQALRPRPAANLGTTSCPAFDEYQAEMVLNNAQGEGQVMDFATAEILHCYYNDDPSLMMQAKLYVTSHANSLVSLSQKQNETSLGQLKELVGRMSGLPGPRGIVLVSPGFIANGVASQMDNLINTALRTGVTISALDARGLYTAASLADVSDADNGSPGWDSIHEAAALANSAVMADLANGTGGGFFQNSNDLNRGFRVTSGLAETAYVLSFSPSNRQLDGRFHTLKVTLTTPGNFSIQARRGYFADNNPILFTDNSPVAPAAATNVETVTTATSSPGTVDRAAANAATPAVTPACVSPCAPSVPVSVAANGSTGNPAASPITYKQKKVSSNLWKPPDVDAPIAGLSPNMPCPLADILKQAGQRAEELVTDLQQFSARETMQAEMMNEFGAAGAMETRDFDYLVFITRGKNGLLAVRENHTATYGSDRFDRSMTDSGLTVLALIFYPPYAEDYDMRCEGQVQYLGRTAWVVYFKQREDKPKVTRSFSTTTGHFPAALKGRAWIDTNTFQVLHLETNLVNWVAGMHLKSEAVSINYAPVQFHIRPVILWLPQSADVFSEFVPYSTGSSLAYAENPRNPRYHASYTFTDFRLFSAE